jgi:glycosyltransferase involved in cell wall biosynthesis
MSMKVPVVVSKDVGCNSEFIESGTNGVLLDPFRDEGWADAIIRLLDDEALRRKTGENGYETCRDKFNINDVAKRFERLYGEIA